MKDFCNRCVSVARSAESLLTRWQGQLMAFVAGLVLLQNSAWATGNSTTVLGPADYGIDFATFATNIALALGAVIAICLGLYFGMYIIKAGIRMLTRGAH